MSSNRLWMLCPSYRDVPSFRVLRTNVQFTVKETPALVDMDLRFVVVDDTGGCDGEISTLRDFPDVRIITPPFNLGHQRAIVYGLRMLMPDVADSDLIVTLDSDGEDRQGLTGAARTPTGCFGKRNSLSVARRTKRSESLRFKVMYTCSERCSVCSPAPLCGAGTMPHTGDGWRNECFCTHTSTFATRRHLSALGSTSSLFRARGATATRASRE